PNYKSRVKGASQVQFSLNLIRAAQRELQFLYFVNRHPALYHGTLVKSAIQRYELLWLPLAANCTEKILAPPSDVHWVWYVHMLAPEHYVRDCHNIVGQIVDHKLFKLKALKKAHKRTRKLWMEMYPDEPFDVILDGSQPVSLSQYTSLISYDLEAAVGRQSAFYYQVSLPHCLTKPFLKEAVERYKKFIYLKSTHPSEFLVPCYDMDIIWHAHMVHPKKYQKDTHRVLGKTLNHDDSVNDRSPGSKLTTSDGSTRRLWAQAFGETFSRNGSMFRGDPPSCVIEPIPPELKKAALGSAFQLHVRKVAIGGAPPGTLKIKLLHQFRNLEKQRLGKITVFKEHGYDMSEHNIADLGFEFTLPDKVVRDQFVLEMVSQKDGIKSMLSSGSQNFECNGHFDFAELLKLRDDTATIIKTFIEKDIRVELTFGIRVVTAHHYATMAVLTGPFQPASFDPATVRSLYGIVPHVYDTDSEQDLYKAEMATHRVVNETWPHRPQVLEVEVYHSRTLLHSAVHLYAESPNGRHLVAVSHTIDNTTIPTPQDLAYTNEGGHNFRTISLNPRRGERGMVIKTHDGDWALVTAEWAGLCNGVPAVSSSGTRGQETADTSRMNGSSSSSSRNINGSQSTLVANDTSAGVVGVAAAGGGGGGGGGSLANESSSGVETASQPEGRGRPGSPGHLLLHIHQLRQFQYRSVILPYERREYTFCLGGVTIDMERGVLEVGLGNPSLVENISLALSAAVLHVLCQPRPDRPVVGQTNRIPVEKLSLLHALGYYADSA
ncbi:hypothetical protein OTU49_015819, partial [Cherax quadricarinatus]